MTDLQFFFLWGVAGVAVVAVAAWADVRCAARARWREWLKAIEEEERMEASCE